MEKGHEIGLIDSEKIRYVRELRKEIDSEIRRIRSIVIKPSDDVNRYLASRSSPAIDNGIHLDQLLKRGEIDYDIVRLLAPSDEPISRRAEIQTQIEIKYEGYIDRQVREIEKFRHLERMRIPEGFDYEKVHGLSKELRGKLDAVRPANLGQASRIDGMTPAALTAMMILLKAAPPETSGS
jgi:tRNA uridine 5-carboxymethylaminomethyl modification enzyme